MMTISCITARPIAISDRATWDNHLARLTGLSRALSTLLHYAEENPPGIEDISALAEIGEIALGATLDLAREVRKLLDAVELAPADGGAA